MAAGRWVLGVLLALVQPASAEQLQGLLDSLDGIRRDQDVAAFALTLIEGERLVYTGAQGQADRANGRAATPDTLFRIGSVTKLFNGLAFLMLAEEGRLALDARLKVIVPDVPLVNPWEGSHPVRIAHLLEHTAGLTDITPEEFNHNTPFSSLRAALDFRPEARRAHWPPGMHSSYSNAGAGLAAYALERVTGMRYEDFMLERVLRPLGMTHASLELDEATWQGLAVGYDSDGHTVIPYWHMVFPAFGAINASARQMAGVLRLLIDRGVYGGRRLLSAESVARMETPRTTVAARSGLAYGYGLGNHQFTYKGFLFHGHGGDGDGYLSRLGYHPGLALGYFVTINAFNRAAIDRMEAAVLDFIVAGRTPPPRPKAEERVEGSEEDLRKLTGSYLPVTWRFSRPNEEKLAEESITVAMRDGRLRLRYPGGKERLLLAVTNRHFRFPGQPVATIALVEEEGVLYLQGDMGNYRRASPVPPQSRRVEQGVGTRQVTPVASSGAKPPRQPVEYEGQTADDPGNAGSQRRARSN